MGSNRQLLRGGSQKKKKNTQTHDKENSKERNLWVKSNFIPWKSGVVYSIQSVLVKRNTNYSHVDKLALVKTKTLSEKHYNNVPLSVEKL